MWSFQTSNSTPSYPPPLSNSHLPIFSKYFYQLGTKPLSTRAYESHPHSTTMASFQDSKISARYFKLYFQALTIFIRLLNAWRLLWGSRTFERCVLKDISNHLEHGFEMNIWIATLLNLLQNRRWGPPHWHRFSPQWTSKGSKPTGPSDYGLNFPSCEPIYTFLLWRGLA